jgi:PAS domain S-box-containing protein
MIYPGTEFFIEYIDAKRTNVSQFHKEFADMLREKYRSRPISLLYATDDIALEFAQAYAEGMGMGDVQIVASGINNPVNLQKSLHPSTIGIREAQSAKKLVSLALRQNPDTKRIVIISDATDVGQDIGDEIEIQTREMCDLPIDRLPSMNWKEVLDRLTQYDRNTLFLLGLYAVDSKGRYLRPYEVATQIAQHAEAPVYAFHDIFTISPAVVGGYVNAGYDQGRMAGDLAVKIFGGKTQFTDNDIGKPGFTWVFNYGTLRRFGIPLSSLPENSRIVGKPVNLLTQHPLLAATVFAGIALQTLLIVYLLFNIRRRVAVTRALKESEARLRLLLENSPLAIFISDTDGRLILLNTQFRKLFGYNISDAKTLESLRRLLVPVPEYRTQIVERMTENARFAATNGTMPAPVEFTARAKDGRNVEVEMYHAEAGNMIFRIIHDVTERNRVMRELRQASTAAMAANEAKSRFIANVSHEIRTPMNGILGMVQLLHETQLSSEQHEYLETIGDSCCLLLTVINDILDLSRIEAGQMKLLPEAVNLDHFLKGVASVVKPSIEEKGLTFHCNFARPLPDTILCDPSRVKQVLLNLLMNACKFTDTGHVSFTVKAMASADGKFQLGFSVNDSGIGIPKEIQTRIFEPFVQGDTSQTRKFGGTGLGLAISLKLVQMMGGEISLESAPGEGSTFSFAIPVEILPCQHNTGNVETGLDSGTAKAHPLAILIVEDNSVNQKVVGLMLRKMGYDHDVATNGLEAVEAATHKHYDVILMDVQMPQMDGLTATKKIRKALPADKQPHIYALTAHAMSDDAQLCLEAGMNGHIVKPLKASALREALVKAHEEIHPAENAR